MKRGTTPERRRTFPKYSAKGLVVVTGVLLGTLFLGLVALTQPLLVSGLVVGLVAGRASRAKRSIRPGAVWSLGRTVNYRLSQYTAH